MNILCYRSQYLRRILASNKKNNDNVLTHIKLPNISPEIFQIILEYIYGGILSLNEHDTSDFLKILAAADNLHLQELINYLQKFLIENKSEWIVQNFGFTQQISSTSNNLLDLQEFCTKLMAQSPEKILLSFNFTLLSEKSLISLIKRDDLQMKEVEVWEHVLKWGLAKNPTLIPDPKTWSDDDFKKMENTLEHCLPLVRFYSLSTKEFSQKVRPYQKLLNRQLYEDLVDSFMDPDSIPNENILLPRNIKIEKIIDSKIVTNLSIVKIISRQIDKMDIRNNFAYLKESYKFKLLLRGSRDGFTPKIFHELCDDKPNTVTFIKIKGIEEVIGGYNPITWKSSVDRGETKDSFIFSFKNNDIKDSIISNVQDKKHAVVYGPSFGPQFGHDIFIYSSNESTDYTTLYCSKNYYEKKIRDTEEYLSIEDYEVFQMLK
uniref:Kelch-like protein 17 n=1 Tax=Rhizophagus irregularis (strain DAOM 181602 / DAOM 197198 / MUCL 43194) TaxID=747089 RepID=U9UQT7_RHIID